MSVAESNEIFLMGKSFEKSLIQRECETTVLNNFEKPQETVYEQPVYGAKWRDNKATNITSFVHVLKDIEAALDSAHTYNIFQKI